MKTGIFLSYKGLGSNILHLSYCHEIAKKFGPVHIITLSPKIYDVLKYDPSIKEVIFLNKYHKRFIDIFKLSKLLKKLELDNIFIFYPSLRLFLSCKFAGINKIYVYPLFKKKRLHLVDAAKEFTKKSLNINDCPTETKIIYDKKRFEEFTKKKQKTIILGIGSSGPTTKWGFENFSKLIKILNKNNDYYFYLLCGLDEEEDAKKIVDAVGARNCESLSKKSIDEIIYYIASSEMYIGNDSFGHHIACQMDKPCYIILLDSPKAYSDYSRNQNRIFPPNIDIEQIDHGSKLNPNSISVEMIIEKINH